MEGKCPSPYDISQSQFRLCSGSVTCECGRRLPDRAASAASGRADAARSSPVPDDPDSDQANSSRLPHASSSRPTESFHVPPMQQFM